MSELVSELIILIDQKERERVREREREISNYEERARQLLFSSQTARTNEQKRAKTLLPGAPGLKNYCKKTR